MSNTDSIPDISYFRLLLLDFIRVSHPERLHDKRLIDFRAEAAADTYSKAILSSSNIFYANEEAISVLFQELYFSKHDTLVNILWNEFSNKVPEEDARELAIKLFPHCEPIFTGYPVSDDFEGEPEYDLLYSELTGAIASYLESHGI